MAQVDDLLIFVPPLFVLLGVWSLIQSRSRNLVGPVVLIAVGIAWQLIALEYATVDEFVAFWPVLVIALGLSIILGQYRSQTIASDDTFSSAFAAFRAV